MKLIFIITCYILSYSSAISLAGCKKELEKKETPSDSLATAKKYLALGDSYTIGQGVTAAERFPFLTVQSLRNENLNINDPQYIATTGWTTLNLINAINSSTLGTYDAVSLLIGVTISTRE